MLKKLNPQAIGNAQEIDSVEHSEGSAMPSMTPKRRESAQQVKRLFGLLPPQDVGDPEAFLTAAIALFAEYETEVMRDAVFKIAKRSDRPTLKLMREVLDEVDAPRARARERMDATRQLPPPPREPRTPEQQARVDEQVKALRSAFGLPPEGLPRAG